MVATGRNFTSFETATRIGVAESYLRKLRMKGTGPAFFKVGRKVLYAVSDVDAWLATKRLTQTPAVWRDEKRDQHAEQHAA